MAFTKVLMYDKIFKMYGGQIIFWIRTVVKVPPAGYSDDDLYQEICYQLIKVGVWQKFTAWVCKESPYMFEEEMLATLKTSRDVWLQKQEAYFCGEDAVILMPMGGNPFGGTAIYDRVEVLVYAINYGIEVPSLKNYLSVTVKNRSKNILRTVGRRHRERPTSETEDCCSIIDRTSNSLSPEDIYILCESYG